MEFVRGRQANTGSVRSGHLSAGTAWRDPVLSVEGAERIEVSTIAFEPGAHIRWHSHGNGQLLIIDHGCGVIATRSGEIRSLQPGDVVYAPPGEEHWHGAAPDAYLGQINISMGATTWLEPVDPEGYRAASEASTS